MAARKSKLGPDFWGNFYRIDNEQHTEEKFRAELASVSVWLAGDCKINIFTVKAFSGFTVKITLAPR